jgi:hypothetical protein
MGLIQKINFRVNKRCLLFIAAFVWTFAGVMLLYKGYSFMDNIGNSLWIMLVPSIAGGLLFYILVFSRISLKHVTRILSLRDEKNSIFAFFSAKSYILMAIMISVGIALRITGMVSSGYLTVMYIVMGVPLLLSSFRFYYCGVYYNKANRGNAILP